MLIDAARQVPSTADVLRAVHLLARRIGSAELEAWADRELSGYPDDGHVPSYRGPFHSEAHVRYRRVVGGIAPGLAPLPPTAFAEELRESKLMRVYEVSVVDPVDDLDDLVRVGAPLVRPWGGVQIDLINRLIDIGGLAVEPGHTIAAAETRLAGDRVAKVVDSVRSRVLGLALGLERVAPDAGDEDGPSTVTPAMHEVIAKTLV
ncbi:hypothetical protein GCM10018954_059260 [Kutzneria kofuensis]|jgi:hypothetical protein